LLLKSICDSRGFNWEVVYPHFKSTCLWTHGAIFKLKSTGNGTSAVSLSNAKMSEITRCGREVKVRAEEKTQG